MSWSMLSAVFAVLRGISVKSAVIRSCMQRHRSNPTCCSGMNCSSLRKYENDVLIASFVLPECIKYYFYCTLAADQL